MAQATAKESFVARLAPALGNRTGILVFTETKDSATRLAYIINRFVPAWPLTSDSKPEERKRVLRRFMSGHVGALCTPRILDEGVDVPDADLAIIVASSSTRRQMIQRMGREIRRKSDERAASIIFTYVKQTPEYPATGGHEAFLDTVTPFALSTETVDAFDSAAIQRWLKP